MRVFARDFVDIFEDVFDNYLPLRGLTASVYTADPTLAMIPRLFGSSCLAKGTPAVHDTCRVDEGEFLSRAVRHLG